MKDSRIIIISNHFEKESSANANRIRSWVHCFLADGKNVLVVQQTDEKAYLKKKSNHLSIQKINLKNTFFSRLEHKTSFLKRVYAWVYFIIYKVPIHKNFLYHFKKVESNFKITSKDLVITTAPNYSTFNVGFYLKKKYNCQWIADYRDVWSSQSRVRKQHFSRKILEILNSKIEKKLISKADKITTVTNSMMNELQAIFPLKEIKLIANGYEDYFENFDFNQQEKDFFCISYLGSLYHNQDEENIFFKALEKFVSEKENPKIKVVFLGTNISTRIKKFPILNKYISQEKWLDTSLIPNYLAKSHVLLHFGLKGSSGMATAKIYAYLKAQKPILFINSYQGEIFDLLEKYQAGIYVNGLNETIYILKKLYNEFLNQKNFMLQTDAKKLKELSRKKQAEILRDWLFYN